jgi:hypothetical protein
MNIIEAHLKHLHQLIILFLGYPCTNKSSYAKDLGVDASLNVINLNDFLIKDKFIEQSFTDASSNRPIKFKLYEHTDNVDWPKFNDTVNNLKSSGVIIHSNFIDLDKFNFSIDFTYYFYSPFGFCKRIIADKNLLHLDKKDINNYFQHVFIPFYSNYDNNIKSILTVFKFFKIKEDTNDNDTYNTLFDTLMSNIQSNIDKKLKK